MTAHDPLFRSEVIEARRQRLEGEVILAQPVRAHVLTALLVGIIALLSAWVVFGTYTRSEVARGILVTDQPSPKILAIRPGRIAELLVHDGDRVAAGQKLATVLVEQADENGASVSAESLAALDAQHALADQQAALAREHASAEGARLGATLDGLSRQRSDLSAQIDLQEEVVASAKAMFDRIGDAVQKGFVSQLDYERRRQAMLAARQQLAQLRQQVNALGAQERQTQAELARNAVDGGTAVAIARTSAEGFVQQHAQALASRAYVITAPASGRVTALQAVAGQTVDGTAPLMTIVPDGVSLHAEIYAPTRAIGFVRSGQEVRLLYDAFPYQRFGSFAGRVTRVSRTVLDPREIAGPVKVEEPVYRIEIALGRQSVEAFGSRLPLQPGMTLSANLILDRRSFADWLLQPLNAVMRRSR